MCCAEYLFAVHCLKLKFIILMDKTIKVRGAPVLKATQRAEPFEPTTVIVIEVLAPMRLGTSPNQKLCLWMKGFVSPARNSRICVPRLGYTTLFRSSH